MLFPSAWARSAANRLFLLPASPSLTSCFSASGVGSVQTGLGFVILQRLQPLSTARCLQDSSSLSGSPGPSGAPGGPQHGPGSTEDADIAALNPENLGTQQPRMLLQIRMDTEYGQDKAVLAQLFNKYGVMIRGGHFEAQRLLSELMVWKQLPAPPADPNWKPEEAEDEGEPMSAAEYMESVNRIYEKAKAAKRTS